MGTTQIIRIAVIGRSALVRQSVIIRTLSKRCELLRPRAQWQVDPDVSPGEWYKERHDWLCDYPYVQVEGLVNPAFRQDFCLLVTDVGEEVPKSMWRNFDFAIVTYDLVADANANGFWCDKAVTLAFAASQQQENSFARICVVGVDLDQIPQNSLDRATTVKRGLRGLAILSTSLKLFPVGCTTGLGLPELVSYIGQCPVLTCVGLLY